MVVAALATHPVPTTRYITKRDRMRCWPHGHKGWLCLADGPLGSAELLLSCPPLRPRCVLRLACRPGDEQNMFTYEGPKGIEIAGMFSEKDVLRATTFNGLDSVQVPILWNPQPSLFPDGLFSRASPSLLLLLLLLLLLPSLSGKSAPGRCCCCHLSLLIG